MAHGYAIEVPVEHEVAAQICPSSSGPLSRSDALEILELLEDKADELDFEVSEIDELFASVSSDAGMYVMMPLTADLNLSWTQVFGYMGWDHTYLSQDYESDGHPFIRSA
jgi:hypothetical protein